MNWWSRVSSFLRGQRKAEMRQGIARAQQRLDEAHDLDDQIRDAMELLRIRRRRNNFGPAVRAAMRGHR